MMFRDQNRSRHRQAFTLIELLVVVAIIAALMAILLPSLGRARAQAKMSACVSNLRQQGTAMAMYAQENGDHPVPAMLSFAAGYQTEWWQLLVQAGCAPTVSWGSTNDTSFRNSIFRCPEGLSAQWNAKATSFTDPEGLKYQNSRDANYTRYLSWYGMNMDTYSSRPRQYYSRSFSVSATGAWTSIQTYNGSNADITLNKLSQLTNPGSIVAIYDGRNLHEWSSYGANASEFQFNVNARHLGTFTGALLADGHAESVQTSRLVPSTGVFAGSTNGSYKWVIDDVN